MSVCCVHREGSNALKSSCHAEGVAVATRRHSSTRHLHIQTQSVGMILSEHAGPGERGTGARDAHTPAGWPSLFFHWPMLAIMRRRALALALCVCAAVAGAHTPGDVTEVLVVFANHLDVGFNHGQALNGSPCLFPPYETHCGWAYSVINNYFDNFFPDAVATGLALRQR